MYHEPCRTRDTDRLETFYVLGTAAIVVAWLLFLSGCSAPASASSAVSPGAVDLIVGQPRCDEVVRPIAPCDSPALGLVVHDLPDAPHATAALKLQQHAVQQDIRRLRSDIDRFARNEPRQKRDAAAKRRDAADCDVPTSALSGLEADDRLRLEQHALRRDISNLRSQIDKRSTSKPKPGPTALERLAEKDDCEQDVASYLLNSSRDDQRDAAQERARLRHEQRAVKRDIERLRKDVRRHSTGRSKRR